MTLTLGDRAFETSTTTGTGTINLAGPVTGFKSFVAAAGNGKKVPYIITDETAGTWETGYGTVTAGSPDTLTRNPRRSSNSNAPVNWGVGTRNVRHGLVADYTAFRDENLNFLEGFGTIAGTADALTLALPVAPLAYSDGMEISGFINLTNTTAGATINVNSLGAISLKINGADPGIGVLQIGKLLKATYKSATGFFELSTPVPASPTPYQTTVPDVLTATKTAGYTATTADGFIPADASAGTFAITLYTAVGNAGKRIIIQKTDATLTQVSITPNGAETIGGKTGLRLSTQHENVYLESDGTNWLILNRRIISEWVAYTPTFTGFGTATNISFFSRRVNDTLEVKGKFTVGASTATEARITLGYNGTNNNVTTETTKLPSGVSMAGTAALNDSSTTFFGICPLAEPSVGYMTIGRQTSITNMLTKANGSIASNGAIISLCGAFPIAGWEG